MARAGGESLTLGLTRRIRSLPVEPGDLAAAERYVRDWVGCVVAGRATEPGRTLLAYGKAQRDLGSRVFVTAALSHVTETDDLHRASITHPGCVVVPVALELGRELNAGGKKILGAVLAGYEAMLRIGEAVGPAHYRVFHNTATAGVFGSAAAAARLLDLDEEAWVWAMGNAGTQAAGLWQFNEDATMSKHLHAGHAAAAGLRAALLAKDGFTGPAAILEGRRGFFRALCPDPTPEAVLAPASGWKLPETSLKPYPCCRHTHPAIDAALEIRARLGAGAVTKEQVEALRIHTYAAAVGVIDDPRPTTPYAAKFSMQFCTASALVHGKPDLFSFEEARLADAEIRDLTERATVEVDPALETGYPARWGARVGVSTRDGGTHVAEQPAARGDPELPMNDDDLDEKLRSLCSFGGITTAETEHLLAASRNLVRGGPAFTLPD